MLATFIYRYEDQNTKGQGMGDFEERKGKNVTFIFSNNKYCYKSTYDLMMLYDNAVSGRFGVS